MRAVLISTRGMRSRPVRVAMIIATMANRVASTISGSEPSPKITISSG